MDLTIISRASVVFIGAIWLITITLFIVSLHGTHVDEYGLLPRHHLSNANYLIYPFIHGSFSHLLGNLLPFTVFALFIARKGLARLLIVCFLCWAGATLGVWIFGRISYHIGLSGIVYGTWAYLLSYALVKKSIKSVLLAVVTLILYGSMIWGILPLHPWLSFESHLFGFLTGILVGWYYASQDKVKDADDHK